MATGRFHIVLQLSKRGKVRMNTMFGNLSCILPPVLEKPDDYLTIARGRSV